jgi:hypothetical protein
MLPPAVAWCVVTSAWKEHAATCEPSTEKHGSDVGKENYDWICHWTNRRQEALRSDSHVDDAGGKCWRGRRWV